MGKGNAMVEAAKDQLEQSESEDEFGNVVIKKRINRQIEQGVYNLDNDEDELPFVFHPNSYLLPI